MTDHPAPRERADRCPGVLRPWIAEDGALVRLRLVAGLLTRASLARLAAVSSTYGDANVHLTARANLQVRGLPAADGDLPEEIHQALASTGLLPAPQHELVRNVMLSPLSGISGGVADLRRAAADYDALLCADPRLADLPGRFLVVLDDGRGDVQGRSLDLGAMAVSETEVQLRAGAAGWGPVLGVEELAGALIGLAHRFLDVRGDGPTTAWHVDELDVALLDQTRDPRTLRNSGPLPYGPFEGGEHVEVPDGVLTPALLAQFTEDEGAAPLIVTPWNGIVTTA